MGVTFVEKIAARHADGLATGAVVRAGDFVSIRPRHVMTHDNTGAVIPKFRQIGATEIADPDRKSTRLNSSHVSISYAVFCLKKKKQKHKQSGVQMKQYHPDSRYRTALRLNTACRLLTGMHPTRRS